MLPQMAKSKTQSGIDSHEPWEGAPMQSDEEDLWDRHILDAAEAAKKSGSVPLGVKRMLDALKQSKQDWRTILANFIHEEVNDYSFSPPDRRFEGDFFLPDFNDTDVSVKKILFMIDTSGSMDRKALTEMYSEVNGAIEQFGGKLTGWLGFFDAQVVPPVPFESMEEFKLIKPKGGGGPSFKVIFDYIRKEMQDDLPSAVIILTDGYAAFPKESDAMGLPVLWVLNTDEQPPFGKIVRV